VERYDKIADILRQLREETPHIQAVDIATWGFAKAFHKIDRKFELVRFLMRANYRGKHMDGRE